MFFKKKAGNRPTNSIASAMPITSDGTEPSFIGRDMVIEGQMSCDGELHIEGAFRGNVRARVCVIDTNGVVQGELSGDVIHVRGRVIGPIQGSKVYIHAGAHVEGDIFQDTISIENGAYVYGTIRHNTQPAPAPVFAPPGAAASEATTLVAEPIADSATDPATSLRMVHSRK